MLTKMHLKNFKGFRDTEIPEFRKVNLILGGQNVGKTSLLEAVVFVAGDLVNHQSRNARYRLARMFRPCEGNDPSRFWKGVLGTPDKPINLEVFARMNELDFFGAGYAATDRARYSIGSELEGVGFAALHGGGNVETVTVKSGVVGVDSPDPFPAFSKSAAEQVTMYGKLVTGKKKKAVFELLRKIEPRLESIDAVAPDGDHRVYADLSDGQVLPLSQLGHGFTRLFELYSGLAVTDSKLALIDEIENGIHYSALPTVFQGIRELADSNEVQSIITTHSLEAIKAACEVFKDKPENFQLIRLERTKDDNIRAVAINDENLKTVMASGWEIR